MALDTQPMEMGQSGIRGLTPSFFFAHSLRNTQNNVQFLDILLQSITCYYNFTPINENGIFRTKVQHADKYAILMNLLYHTQFLRKKGRYVNFLE